MKKWAIACALFYGFGLLIFHAKAKWEVEAWTDAYFLWQFVKDALMMVMICSINKVFMRLLLPLLIYSIIRLCLEIITVVTNGDANNPLIVTILFLAGLTACLYLSIIFLREKWKQNY